MSVGVFVPCYNTGRYVAEALNSIINQTYQDWEIVVLDDASEDNTYEIAKKYESNKIKVYKNNEHCGKIGKLKNESINKFEYNHEYICHVGSDDIIPDYCFKTFVDYMDKHLDVGACCGNFICFTDDGKQWSLPHVTNSGEFDSSVLLRYNCLFPMRFYRTSVIKEIGGYSNDLTSAVDFDVALKISEKTIIHRIKEPITYYYRQHSIQISTRARTKQDLNAKKALESALERRGIKGKVINNKPPFVIEYEKEIISENFIWKRSK